MKVLFSAFGMGLGHAGRMLAISNILRNKGVDVVYSTFGPAYNFLKKEGYDVIKIPEVKFAENKDGGVNLRRTFIESPKILYNLTSQSIAYRKVLKKLNPDLAFSDSDFAVLPQAKLRRIKTLLLIHQLKIGLHNRFIINSELNVNLQYMLRHLCDKIIVPDVPPPYTIYQKNLPISKFIKSKLVFGGILVRQSVGTKKISTHGKPLVFVTLSGPGESKKTLLDYYRRILPVLKDKFFVFSEGIPTDNANQRFGNGLRYSWLSDNLRNYLMQHADVIVSRSGYSTVSEILWHGKRSILTPIPNQPEQEFISKNLDKRGLAKEMLQGNIAYFPQIVEDVIKDKPMKKEVRRYSKILHKYDGAKNIANLILSELKK